MRELLANSAFRRLLTGRLLNTISGSFYYIAAMWLVYSLGGSVFFTGLAGFLSRAPTTLQFLIGPVVDGYDLRVLLVASVLAQAFLLSIIPLAAWSGTLNVWVVLLVMPLVAVAGQFGPPAQNAALPRIIDNRNLAKANTAFTVSFQSANMVFMALGGIIVALVGAIALFMADVAILLVAAFVLGGMSIPAANNSEEDSLSSPLSSLDNYVTDLKSGWSYFRQSILLQMLAGILVLNFVTGIMFAILPGYADTLGGSEAYGILLAAISGGVLLGSLIAPKVEKYPFSWLVIGLSILSTVTWTLAVFIPAVLPNAGFFLLTWIFAGTYNVLSATLKQTYVPEDMMGRASSISYSAASLAMPMGSLLGGTLAEIVGIIPVMLTVSVGFCFLSGYWILHPTLRSFPSVPRIDPVQYGLKKSKEYH